ncbi:hypothetical protein ACFL3E_00550 [Patescibacteria group bacterium]
MWYKGENHFKEDNGYEIKGIWYPRVTRIVNVKSKPALDNFFKEMGSYEAAENVKNKSAEEGSQVHEVAQKILSGGSVDISPEMQPVADALEEFNREKNIFFHPEFVEKRIWSNLHKFAGTVDALTSIDGKFGVLDIKTSTGFFPDYNLQTAAYILALQENMVKEELALPNNVETRWILRIDQQRKCSVCGSKLREKGGRKKIRENGKNSCSHDGHQWEEVKAEIELKEFPYFFRDIKAFLAAKTLWEWENNYWLRKIGYAK